MKDRAAIGPGLEEAPPREARRGQGGPAFISAQRLRSILTNACLSLLIFTAFIGFTPVVIFGDDGAAALMGGGGDSVRQASFTLLFVLILATSLYTNGAAFLLRVPTALVVLLLWCWASVVWAIEPSTSLRRIIFTTIVVLSVIYAVRVLRYEAVLSVIYAWFAAILLADWLVMPLLPQAVHGPGELDEALIGMWRGIHVHKNEAGAFCAIASLFFMHMTVTARSFVVGPVLTVLALAFLYMTGSKTSGGFIFVAVAAGCAVEYAYRNPNLRRFVLLGLPGVLLAAYLLFESKLGDLLLQLEDPSSLTGRSQIWPVLLQYSSEHPFLGSGYGSFWAIGDASPIYDGSEGWLTTITHAHNGYLDVLIQVGLIGLLIAVAGLVLYPMHVLLTRRLRGAVSRWLLCAVLVFCWLHNMLETSLLDRANVVWVTMLIAYGLLRTDADAQPPEARGR